MSQLSILYSDIKDFVYITLKLQARMHELDESFYSVKSTYSRINTYIFTRLTNDTKEGIGYAKEAMMAGFERLKDEEDLPMFSYDTVEELRRSFEDRLGERNVL